MRRVRHLLVRPFVVMPLVGVLALGGFLVLRPDSGGNATNSTAATVPQQVVQAATGTLAKTVSAEGTVAAATSEDLSFSSAGTVTAVNVAAGDTVKAGQVLAAIDPAELEATVADAEASLAEAQATLSDDEDAGASDAQLTADESSVTSANDRLAAAREALGGAELVSTYDGRVASVDLTVGEQLGSDGSGATTPSGSASGSGKSAGTLGAGGGAASAGSGQTAASTAQIQVISTGSFAVDLSFDATDVANVAVGQLATVTLSTSRSSTQFPGGFAGGFPGGRAQATAAASTANSTTTTTAPAEVPTAAGPQGLVTKVGSVADASSGVASYPVTVRFDDASGDFNVGAKVTVAITYDHVENAVQVPSRAVSTEGTTSRVTVRGDGGDETRTVTTGLTSNGMVQITSGLKTGESVVITFGRPGGTGSGTPSGAGPGGGLTNGGGGGQFTPPAGFDPTQAGGPGR